MRISGRNDSGAGSREKTVCRFVCNKALESSRREFRPRTPKKVALEAAVARGRGSLIPCETCYNLKDQMEGWGLDLSDADILHVAKLCRLRLKPDELASVRHDLNRVLSYVAELQTIDLSDVKPTMHVLETEAPLRHDEVEASLANSEATKNGPEVRDGMFLVPRIMESGAQDE